MRIAAVQCPDIPDDADRVTDVVLRWLRWADGAGVDITLFPEAFLLGHSYDPQTIRRRAGAATDALLTLFERVKAYRSTLVVGAFELADDRIFNTAIVIEAGNIVGRYAKVHPNEPGVTAGSAFPTFRHADVPYGINICNDANHPSAARRIADRDARLILYPLNNMLPPATAERWRDKSVANLIDRARETGCWVASSDVTGTAGDRVSHGCTAIVSPEGAIVARVPEMQEGVAVYDLPSDYT